MPSPRFENLSEEKRTQILAGAGREFAEHGYDGATISLILGHIGLSTGKAYYYFDSKADLFAAVVRFHLDAVLARFGGPSQLTDPASFWPSLATLFASVLQETYEIHRVLGALRLSWKLSSEARSIQGLAEQFARLDAWIEELVVCGQRVGAIRTDLPESLLVKLLLALDAGFDDWLYAQPAGFGPAEMQTMLPILVDGLKRMLSP